MRWIRHILVEHMGVMGNAYKILTDQKTWMEGTTQET
jgi:hypothetical protein